jgi:hypothetical protein
MEQEAIIDAIQKLPTTGVRRLIFNDALSAMMAASGISEISEDQKD